jgi:hypothetical protein
LAEYDERRKRLLAMLHFSLWGWTEPIHRLDEGMQRLWANASRKAELRELAPVLRERILRLTVPYQPRRGQSSPCACALQPGRVAGGIWGGKSGCVAGRGRQVGRARECRRVLVQPAEDGKALLSDHDVRGSRRQPDLDSVGIAECNFSGVKHRPALHQAPRPGLVGASLFSRDEGT